MSYLVLHIDVEFIVGTVCADNGTTYPITNGKEDLLWLYFFNNPHQNIISYGKDNKIHFNNSEVNYYGKFFEKIEKQEERFILRGIEHPIIDLLKESKLLDNIKETYLKKTLDNCCNIPLLLTFSSSISDNMKQKIVDFLNDNGFETKSYTIPLAELVGFHALNNKKIKGSNGSIAIFLEAINSTLHLIKLTHTDNYFLIDGKPQTREGMGFDPRKLALLRFVVNEANKSIGALFTDTEKMEECKRLELLADDWLKKLDSTNSNMPYNIRDISFSKMPSSKRQVLVRKSDLDNDTGIYTNKLKDIFDVFLSDNTQGDVAAVVLIGDCFQSNRVKTSFEHMIGADKLFFYSNNDIHEILAEYPKIDISRYASEEERIKERAKAEEFKQAEQRALEDRLRKEQEIANKKAESELKAEENRKEAKKLFDRAVDLEKTGKLEDARVNVENAIELDKTNKEYKFFYDDLKDKIKKLIEKTELYKKYLSSADDLLKKEEFEKALEEYEAAKYVFDNAEIIAKIIEVKRIIKLKEKLKLKITQLLTNVKEFIQQKDFQNARSKIDEILTIDKANAEAIKLLSNIDEIYKNLEIQFNAFVKSADNFFNIENYVKAIYEYNQALSIKSDDKYCILQLKKIENAIQQQKVNQENGKKIVIIAEKFFQEGRWLEAQGQYQLALNLCPQDKSLLVKLNECISKIKEQEDKFSDLLMNATILEKKGKLKDSLEALEDAKKIRPDDEDIKKRIKNIKFAIEFDDNNCFTKNPTKIEKKSDDDFLGIKTNEKIHKESVLDDNFLGIKKNNSSSSKKNDDDSLLKKTSDKIRKESISDDDFLGIKKNNSTSSNKNDDDFLGTKGKSNFQS